LALGHLDKAKAAFAELYSYLDSKGRIAQVLDDRGVYKKKAPQEAMEARLVILKSLCVAREEADQAALKARKLPFFFETNRISKTHSARTYHVCLVCRYHIE